MAVLRLIIEYKPDRVDVSLKVSGKTYRHMCAAASRKLTGTSCEDIQGVLVIKSDHPVSFWKCDRKVTVKFPCDLPCPIENPKEWLDIVADRVSMVREAFTTEHNLVVKEYAKTI